MDATKCMALYLGVDGGGSHTVALVGDHEGHILGRGEAKASNVYSAGLREARDALRAAVGQALSAAGAQQPVAVACLGLAGAGRPAEQALWQRWAEEANLAKRVLVVNDCDLVLAAGTPAGWGLALIAGTGSIALGRSPEGAQARAGGWGYLLGDEGSGYAVGLAALQAIARAADSRAPGTSLTQAVLTHWQLDEPSQLVGFVYRPSVPRAEIAGLAPFVEAAAAAGDVVAQGILKSAGAELARALDAVARRLGLTGDAIPCALGGSLLVRGDGLRREALHAAAELGWNLWPVALVEEPAVGALRLARGKTLVAESGGSEGA